MPDKPHTRDAAKAAWDALRFRLLVTVAMRVIVLYDGIAIWASAFKFATGPLKSQILAVKSFTRRLDARLLLPSTPAQTSVLILHGIGERLVYWRSAQDFLARHGIASLIIDYSGYGKSEGAITPSNLRQDAIAGYAELRLLLPHLPPPFVLGLSLGTGIAVDAAPYLEPKPSGIILCEAFSSLRSAASAVCRILPVLKHFSGWLPNLMPDLYRTESLVGNINVPLLLVHSDADELFPVEMARDIFAANRHPQSAAELVVLHGYGHNDAYMRPSSGYWQPILDFIHRVSNRSSARPQQRLTR